MNVLGAMKYQEEPNATWVGTFDEKWKEERNTFIW